MTKQQQRRCHCRRRSPLVPLFVIAAIRPAVADGGDFFGGLADVDFSVWPWSGLVKCLLGLFFVNLGLHLLLYGAIATHRTWRRYLDRGIAVPGTVLSCDPSSDADASRAPKYEIAVIYEAQCHRHPNDARLRFRHPDAVVAKRFVRRFEVDTFAGRGTVVQMLTLPGMPRSGCLREVAERSARREDCIRAPRTWLVLIPGLTLGGIFLWLATGEVTGMDDPTAGWVVLASALIAMGLGTQAWCADRYERERNRRFNCALPMKVSSWNRAAAAAAAAPPPPTLAIHGHVVQGTKSEPLLPNHHDSQGRSLPPLVARGVEIT